MTSPPSPPLLSLLLLLLSILPTSIAVVNVNNLRRTTRNPLQYEIYPRRVNNEAAVIEWGHSAVISAVDAVVAKFGVQTESGPLFECEAEVRIYHRFFDWKETNLRFSDPPLPPL